MTFPAPLLRTLFTTLGLAVASLAYAHGPDQPARSQIASSSPSAIDEPTPLPSAISDLKFHDFFNMPVGPRGLEPTQKLLSLNGKRIRIVGYMARAETPTPGMFILSPLPVDLGDEDESLSDDLPPSSLFVHLDRGNLVIPHLAGLIKLTGVLSIGNREEADGHVSLVRLQLDSAATAELARAPAKTQASN